MSSYFREFPKVFYNFGDEKVPVLFQDLTKYSDLIETFKDEVSTYIEYEIRDGDRPDTLSQKLYGRPDYDWTFFLMNPLLKETGWPMSLNNLYERVVGDYYPYYVAKLDVDSAGEVAQYADLYPVNTSVLINGIEGIVVAKDLEVGEIVISADSDIRQNISMSYSTPTTNPLTSNTPLTNVVYEYEGVHHYVNDSDLWIDFFFSTDTTKVPVTNLEYLINENEKSKRIRIIKKAYIEQFVGRIKELIASS